MRPVSSELDIVGGDPALAAWQSWSAWLATPPGRYLSGWSQAQLDLAVADCFGFHALQLGMPDLEALRANRMPRRWLAVDHAWPGGASELFSLYCEFDALPFPKDSLDLVVLPHTLERAPDPHRCLREVERVLRPEGRLVILGLNPASLWALRQNLGLLRGRLSGAPAPLFMPRLPGEAELIGYWRLRDWLRLLGMELETVRFGGYRPPLQSDKWLQRWQGLERLGAHWWPVLGAVYLVVAVKRVHGMRLVGRLRQRRRQAQTAPAVAMQHHRDITQDS